VWAPAFFPFFSHIQNGWPENVECTGRPPLKRPLLWNNRSNYLAKKKKNDLGELGPKHALNWEWSHTRTGLPVQWVMAMSTGQQAPQLQAGQ